VKASAIVRLRWTENNTPVDYTLDLPVDPHSESASVVIGRRRIIVNVCGVQDAKLTRKDQT
jgi:hypothetical protein